ncbi:MAG: 30S ribosomal protein S2 [Parcubacteria group bacterium GW2011_GWF2_38_76]|nr:MAG: 30S ribosomal protein S2 [Parcubacteria group bacterium GW2011_GWF2_38_76]HBM45504.1 30S ribosomal protein S2 [Patescibacteria group bacterium]
MAETEQKLDFSGLEDKNLASLVEELYKAGAHFGYSRSRRHPSVKNFIFGSKNRMDIIDLEPMAKSLKTALEFVARLGAEGKQILFVGNKKEAQDAVIDGATKLNMPYVALRWMGGTLTNAPEIRKRVARMEDLIAKKAVGGLDMYTKKERLLLDREVAKLQKHFGGVVSMKRAPAALIVVDSRNEETGVAEARMANIPVIGLSGTDNNISNINFPIVANDSSRASISLFINKIVEAYRDGIKNAPKPVAPVAVSKAPEVK